MFFAKLHAILQTVYGWMCAAVLFFINIFEGYETAITTVVVCVALDTAWGIAAQVKQGRFALSALGREGMISKWALYASVIIAFIHIERLTDMQSHISVIVVCTLIALVEVWSMSGSALIINPRMPFLRLFRRVLTGEIAHKMNIPENEVRKYLNIGHNEKHTDAAAGAAQQQPAEHTEE